MSSWAQVHQLVHWVRFDESLRGQVPELPARPAIVSSWTTGKSLLCLTESGSCEPQARLQPSWKARVGFGLATTLLIPEMLRVISQIRSFGCGTSNLAGRGNNSRRNSDKSRLCHATNRRSQVRFWRQSPTILFKKTRLVAEETPAVGCYAAR